MRIAGIAQMVMVLVLLIAGVTVFAQDRYALVIQNDRYADLALPAVGPAVEELTDRLEHAAFAVTHVRNGAKREVLGALQEIESELAEGDTLLVYFAGAGFQHEGVNYVLPANAPIRNESDIGFESVAVDRLSAIGDFTEVGEVLVFLEAAYPHPMADRFASVESGFSLNTSSVRTLVVTSASPGQLQATESTHFTRSLSELLLTPDLEINSLVTQLRREVVSATGGAQLPFASSSLFDTFFFVRESGLSAAEGDVFLLRIAGGVEGAEVYVDGVFVGESPLDIYVPSGEREVAFRANDYSPAQTRISGAAGQEVELTPELELNRNVELINLMQRRESLLLRIDEASSANTFMRVVSGVSFTFTLGSAVLATGLLGWGFSEYLAYQDEGDQDQIDSRRNLSQDLRGFGGVFFGVSLVTGAVTFFTDPDGELRDLRREYDEVVRNLARVRSEMGGAE